jgi:nitroreductase
MELQTAFTTRRSIRHYTDKRVPREHLEMLIKAAELAPVSCNLQLTKYIIVDDTELIKTLRKEVSYKFAYTPSFIIVVHDTRFTIERSSGIMSAGMAVEWLSNIYCSKRLSWDWGHVRWLVLAKMPLSASI